MELWSQNGPQSQSSRAGFLAGHQKVIPASEVKKANLAALQAEVTSHQLPPDPPPGQIGCSIDCDYFASPDGAGDGLAQSTPFKVADFWNLEQQGVSLAGKALCLLDGVYQGNDSMIKPPRGLSGEEGSPITVCAEHDGKVTIDGQGQREPVLLNDSNWFVLEGFNAHSSHTSSPNPEMHASVVGLFGSNHTIIRRVVGWNAQDRPIFLACITENIT